MKNTLDKGLINILLLKEVNMAVSVTRLMVALCALISFCAESKNMTFNAKCDGGVLGQFSVSGEHIRRGLVIDGRVTHVYDSSFVKEIDKKSNSAVYYFMDSDRKKLIFLLNDEKFRSGNVVMIYNKNWYDCSIMDMTYS